MFNYIHDLSIGGRIWPQQVSKYILRCSIVMSSSVPGHIIFFYLLFYILNFFIIFDTFVNICFKLTFLWLRVIYLFEMTKKLKQMPNMDLSFKHWQKGTSFSSSIWHLLNGCPNWIEPFVRLWFRQSYRVRYRFFDNINFFDCIMNHIEKKLCMC